MKCEAQYGTQPLSHPCPHPATSAVIAPGVPDFVCGYHARAYTEEGRIRLRFFGSLADKPFMRNVVSFLKEMTQLGFGVTVEFGDIVIQVRGSGWEVGDGV